MGRVLVFRRRAVIGVSVMSAAMSLVGAGRAAAGVWRIEALPGPPHAALAAVSCSQRCTAVGSIEAGRSQLPSGPTLVEHGSLAGWSIQSTPLLPSLGDVAAPFLSDVSCTSASFCIAVGAVAWADLRTGTAAGDSGIAERWSGRKWSVLMAPTVSQESELLGVSCTSPHARVAVGFVGVGPKCAGSGGRQCSFEGTVGRWDGRRWSIRPFPQRQPVAGLDTQGPALFGGFAAVSCASEAACVAVSGAVAERWDGWRWSAERIPAPKGLQLGLASVSCASATFCTAVGTAMGRSGRYEEAIVEHWNGKRWSRQRVADRELLLESVSCPSRDFCVALGGSAVEVWNGTRWSLGSATPPRAHAEVSLSGVACTSRRVCTAVGTDARHYRPLVERYS